MISIKLFKSVNLSDINLLQNEGLVHNNLIKIAVWENQQLWLYSQPNVMLSLDISILISQISALSRMHQIITHEFVFQLWWLFMLSFDDQWAWQNLINNTHKDLRSVYHCLNVKLSAEKSAIDDVTCISELSSIILHQLQIKDLLFLFFLLMISFFFELKTTSIFSSAEVYFCESFIHCWFCTSVVINILKKLESFNFVFVNDHKKILKYFNRQWDVCIVCHQYNKAVNFKICHFLKIVSIYMQSTRHQHTRLSGFSHEVQWL